jgi:hypothetical protein
MQSCSKSNLTYLMNVHSIMAIREERRNNSLTHLEGPLGEEKKRGEENREGLGPDGVSVLGTDGVSVGNGDGDTESELRKPDTGGEGGDGAVLSGKVEEEAKENRSEHAS